VHDNKRARVSPISIAVGVGIVGAAIAEYRRVSPYATVDKLAVSGEVNRTIAAAINARMMIIRFHCYLV